MSQKITYEIFKNKIKNKKIKYDYSLITEEWWQENYSRAQKTKIPIVCKKHGVFYQTVFDHLQGHGCLTCAGKQKWTINKIKNDLKKFNLKFIEIEKNLNLKNKTNSLAQQYLIYKCSKHGTQKGKVRIVCKNGCPKCSKEINKNKNRKNDLTLWKKRIKNFDLLINEKDFENIYTNAQTTKISAKCKICGKIYNRTLFHFWQKGTCSCQKNSNLLQLNDFLKRAKEIHKDKYNVYDYSLITKEFWDKNYIGKYKTKIPIVCKKHGVFYQRVSDHLQGSGCPKCNESKGERKIRQYLEENNIEYFIEYQVPESKLRFDFYLPKYNIAIEYDGEQHFTNKITRYNLKKIKQRDFLKNKLCFIYKINLIRIPYWEYDNIEKILNLKMKG